MASFTLVSGASSLSVDGVDSVQEAYDLYRESLNIPAGATPTVNGKSVSSTHQIQDGDEVAFTKPTGQKG